MTRYAEDTSVDAGRSQQEIDRCVRRFGARKFCSGWDEDHNRAWVEFEVHGRHVRFNLQITPPTDKLFTETPTGRTRSETEARRSYEQEFRRAWRGLSLLIKAKLVAITDGITEFEHEFLGQFVLQQGAKTFGEAIMPYLDKTIQRGLPALPASVKEGER